MENIMWKNKKWMEWDFYLLNLIMIMVLTSVPVRLKASFENIDIAAEAMKSAEAYTARKEGIVSLYYNAAGLTDLDRKEINVQYSRMMLLLDNDNLNYFNAMIGFPVKHVSWAVSFSQFSSELYSEQVMGLGSAFSLFDLFRKRLSLGLRVKLLRIRYGENDYTRLDRLFVNSGYERTGLGLDAGLLLHSLEGFSYGVCFMNINTPDLTLEETGADQALVMRAGVSYSLILSGVLDKILLDLDMEYKKKDIGFYFGIEPYFQNGVFVPGLGLAIGNKKLAYLTAGMSYQLRIEGVSFKLKLIDYLLQFNYSFRFALNGMQAGTYGDHFISISFKF
ncbi:MAG: hypothetical protein PHF84_06065 [bacterium]|nr:hypothetical protein [bacterium]